MAIGINLGRDEDSPPSFEEYDGSILSHKYLMDSYEFGRSSPAPEKTIRTPSYMATKKAAPAKTTKKAASDEVLEEIEKATKTPKFDVRAFYRGTIDDVSRRQGVEADPMEDIQPLSTGLLMLDLLYGGGIRPAMYTHAGDEQTAKTTLALMVMVNAVNKNVPLIAFWDYEGSTKNSKPYLASILKSMGAKVGIRDVFGKKDKETGKWVVHPVVQYYPETVGEKFFDWMASIQKQYPDKRMVAGKWWLIYEDNKANKAMIGDAHDPKMAKKYGKGLWLRCHRIQEVRCLILWQSCIFRHKVRHLYRERAIDHAFELDEGCRVNGSAKSSLCHVNELSGGRVSTQRRRCPLT